MSVTADQAQRILQQTLKDFAALSRSDDPPQQVVGNILEAMLRISGAGGALAWMPVDKDGSSFHTLAQAGRAAALAVGPKGQALEPVHETLSRSWHGDGRTVVVAPEQSAFDGTPLHKAVQFYTSVECQGRRLGVMQLVSPPDLDPKAYREFAMLAGEAAKAIGANLARRQTRVVEQHATRSTAILQTTRRLAGFDDPEALLHELVNRARPMLSAHRASAVGLWGRRPSVVVSDAVEPNRKAVLLRTLAQLGQAGRDRGAPLSFAKDQPLQGQDEPLAPLLDDLYGLGHAGAVHLCPIRWDEAVIGVLVVEYESAEQAAELGRAQQDLAEQVGPLLGKAVRWQTRPLRRVSDWLGRVRQRPRSAAVRAAVVAGVLAAVGVGLFAVPVPLVIRTDASLEPQGMALLTMPHAGTVDRVLVRNGEVVERGAPLAELDRTDLELELAAIRTAIAEQEVQRDAARIEGERHAIQSADLQIRKLEIQARAAQRKLDASTLAAPIRGVVLTPRPGDLEGMTLEQGAQLIELGDLGTFYLVMDVQEADLALIQRQLAAGEAVTAQFLSRAWPDRVQQAQITGFEALSPTAVPKAPGEPQVFRVTVPVQLDGLDQQWVLANPSGRAKLEAGMGSVASRYFRRAWNFFYMTLFF